MEPLTLSYDLATLKGKSALITGGASGLGLATAQCWADAGVYVTIADIQPPLQQSDTTSPILSDPSQVHYVYCDVTSWDSQVAAFKAALAFSPTGSLDLVAAFAGTALAPGNQVDHVLAAGPPSLERDPPQPTVSIRNIEVNLIGSYYTSWLGLYYLRIPASQPKMTSESESEPKTKTATQQSTDKSLLFCASIAAYMDSPKASTYPASKFGVRGLFRSTRAQTRQLGVRCNLLAPWFVDTPLVAPIKRAMAARGVDMAKVLAFTSVEACVEAASYCVANTGVHGQQLMAQFIEELGISPALDGPYDNLMQGWKTILGTLIARYTFPAPDTTVHTEDVTANGVRVRIYTPPEAENPPVALYFHAGGWVMGSVDEEDGFVRALSKATGAKILSVAYRLAPQFPFPLPLEDCVNAARWALDNTCSSASQTVTLIGASAGGNMALSTALALIEAGLGERVAGVVGLAPVTVHPDAVPREILERGGYTSYAENDRVTVNTGSAMRTFFDCYGADPGDPRLSVLLHPRLSELRRVYLAVGGADTLRDDARLMEKALAERGVSVQLDEYPGFPHFSWLFPCPALRTHQGEFFGNLVKAVGWASR
ncbi:Alpha/Beta hydrolase protein [Aspergillus lucknowensis]|uniref:Alpha/Beta hydrolase protein n=1 Tax=Aspergillus lucknowensis TaxID=176173 RepID=A0ABR4LSI2_9EURO